MSREVEWSRRALREITRLDRHTQHRVLAAIDDLAERNQGDVRRLHGVLEGAFALRVGGWRVLFSYGDAASLLILRVRPRGDVYKG